MRRQPFYSCSVHAHFIAQSVAFQIEGARRSYHTRVIRDRFAYKTDPDPVPDRFNRTGQHLIPTHLGAHQFQRTLFQNGDRASFGMGW